MRSRLSIVIAVLLATLPAFAADIGGNWKVTGTIGEFPIDIVCALKQMDNKLAGTCRGMDIGELPVTGEAGDKTASWSYTVNFQGQPITVVYNATIESATAMKGSVSVMGGPAGSFSAAKQ